GRVRRARRRRGRRRARGRRRRGRAARRPDRLRVAGQGLRRAGAARPSPRDLAPVRAPHVTRPRRAVAPAVEVAELWPVYFVGRDLVTKRVSLRRGQLWPSQTKSDIRLWASAFGEDERAAWHTFRFVETLDVPTQHVDAIISRGMTRDEAVAYLAATVEGTR